MVKKISLLILAALVLCASALAEGEIVRVQERLIVLGYMEDAADGIYGNATKDAVSRLRADLGLSEGDIDDSLTKALFEGGYSGVSGMIRENEEGEYAKRIQRRLYALRYLADAPDGIFGSGSMKALRCFASDNGMEGADESALLLLFSENAVQAVHAALHLGDKGNAVSALQEKLLIAGFWDGYADGQYGRDTVKGVKNLQSYLNGTDEAYRLISGGAADGTADPKLLSVFLAADFSAAPTPTEAGNEGMEVRRLQMRLKALGYLDAPPDGGYGKATKSVVAAFQARNGLKKTGKANIETLALLHSENARASLKPYKVVVSLSEQKVFVYEAGKDESYRTLIHTFPCSAGCRTGNFEKTEPEEAIWIAFPNGKWAKHVYRVDGDLFIHSTWFDAENGTPDRVSVNGLGKAVLGNSVLLSEPDAMWIWQKCPKGTIFEVVE
ncbi:MAG: L,D-transpeptidase family protein [Christensenellales bacterium]|jgi:peptidoglycan hydrolase-like protein with peptidoglycan-binding domain